ncbi:MAG: capsular biosynthesis protein [Bernardetiaceae bacterium]|nr:capsular biosynthesis protein [Bernardetiaceae bacterium]
MFSFFSRSKNPATSATPRLPVDMHSHLLPGIDDGAQTLEQSLGLVRQMIAEGYQKLVMTPHVMGDFYQNTPEVILGKLAELRAAVASQGLDVELAAAAEYYLDESFMARLARQEKLLTFGDRFLLFETSFLNASPFIDQVVFQLQSQGYRPVLAHPERYVYLYENPKKLYELHERGVHLQVNLNSLTGYYSKPAKTLAEKLIKDKVIDFLGSDCHGERHLAGLSQARQTPAYHKALEYPLLNFNLLDKELA